MKRIIGLFCVLIFVGCTNLQNKTAAEDYIVGAWGGQNNEMNTIGCFVSKVVVNGNHTYALYTATSLNISGGKNALKNESWKHQGSGRWEIEEQYFSDTGDKYFFLAFLENGKQKGGGLIIRPDGYVQLRGNELLDKVSPDASPYDCSN